MTYSDIDIVRPDRSRADAPAWSPTGGPVALRFAVLPSPAGWRLQGDAIEPLCFATGAAAERQGRRLARAVASGGRDAQVNVYDRARRLVGAITYYGQAGAVNALSPSPTSQQQRGAAHDGQ